MLDAVAIATILLYFCASGLQVMGLTRRRLISPALIIAVSGLAILLHAVLLHWTIDLPDGQNLTFFNTLSQVLWITALVVLLMAFRRPLVNLGIIVFPLAGVSVIFVMVFSGRHIIDTGADPAQLLHILLSFLALGILLIAALQACLLALLDKALRKKYSNALTQSLPPLQIMESLLFQLIALDFCILTAVIYTGMLFYPNVLAAKIWHHMLLAILAWLIFGVLLVGRMVFGWRGRIAVGWTLVGTVILILAYMASQFWSF